MTEAKKKAKAKPATNRKKTGKIIPELKTSLKKQTTMRSADEKTPVFKTLPPGTTMTQALGETFLVDLITDWQEHGGGVIETCRTAKPDAYLKLVATYAPKEFRKTLEPFEGMSDRDLKIRFQKALEEIRALGLDQGA